MKLKSLVVPATAALALAVPGVASAHGPHAHAAKQKDCIGTGDGSTSFRVRVPAHRVKEVSSPCKVTSDDDFNVSVKVNGSDIDPFDVGDDFTFIGDGRGILYEITLTDEDGGPLDVVLANRKDSPKRVRITISG